MIEFGHTSLILKIRKFLIFGQIHDVYYTLLTVLELIGSGNEADIGSVCNFYIVSTLTKLVHSKYGG